MYRVVIAVGCTATVFVAALFAQTKQCTIRWHGHAWFVLETSKGTKVVFDPHAIAEYGSPKVSGDLLLITHPHNDHNRREVLENADKIKTLEGVVLKGKTLQWNAVQETFRDVKIRTVGAIGTQASAGIFHDQEEGAKRGKNAIFVVEADGLTFVHMGDMGHELSEDQVKAIGPVDVLFIPVGGIYTINGEKAKEIVNQLKPKRYIIPMHYGTKVYTELQPPDEFLDGQKNVRKLEDGNLLSIPLDVKADKPTIIMLGWR